MIVYKIVATEEWAAAEAAGAFAGAAVDRAGANGFARLTGFWPGPKETEKSEAAEAVR